MIRERRHSDGLIVLEKALKIRMKHDRYQDLFIQQINILTWGSSIV